MLNSGNIFLRKGWSPTLDLPTEKMELRGDSAVELAETDKAAAVDQHVRKRRKLSPDHEKPDVPAPKAAKQNKDLEEFMSVMAKKPKGRAWDDSDPVNNQNTKDVKKKSQPDNQTSGDMTDLDWMKSHMTKKGTGS
ncbi:hypothetical protein FRC02_011675 [Tulasnella sp. 418]|nr:hypothetical protein FRC02_011675 [Tulasnella sp. 418]